MGDMEELRKLLWEKESLVTSGQCQIPLPPSGRMTLYKLLGHDAFWDYMRAKWLPELDEPEKP